MTVNGKPYTSRLTIREDPMLADGTRRTSTAPAGEDGRR
jgi:hypothetical protein